MITAPKDGSDQSPPLTGSREIFSRRRSPGGDPLGPHRLAQIGRRVQQVRTDFLLNAVGIIDTEEMRLARFRPEHFDDVEARDVGQMHVDHPKTRLKPFGKTEGVAARPQSSERKAQLYARCLKSE